MRSRALEKLAAISAQEDGEDVAKLSVLLADIPLGHKELEVLVALSKAAPLVREVNTATDLLQQLSPYVTEAHKQTLEPSLLHQQSPPWESLAYDLTAAVLALGLGHLSLRSQALACIDRTIEELSHSAKKLTNVKPGGISDLEAAEQSLRIIQLAVSLLGFLNAAAKYVQIWNSAERVSMIKRVRGILSEDFMISVQAALSAVRNARTLTPPILEWKRWLRHYAARKRPLGAMLLGHAFMSLVEESLVVLMSTYVPVAKAEVLDALLLRQPLMDRTLLAPSQDMLETFTELIADEVDTLEADADHPEKGSAWRQRLALEFKASSLRSFLYCSALDESIADADVLMAWLDTTAQDPVQMADAHLAQTVLKCMAVLGRLSPAIASRLTRSFPKLIVQGKMTPRVAALAGECLARVMKPLSQDVVISTLYNLGNVLSASGSAGAHRSSSPSPWTGEFFSDPASTSLNGKHYQAQRALGSAISLVIHDEQEATTVSGSVVQAIVAIATACNDDKITGLVISMLVQKVSRISTSVDAKIIAETAALGLCGGPTELGALLRLYARIASQALHDRNDELLGAVTEARIRLATWVRKDSRLYEPYLTHLLSLIVSSGDTAGERAIDVALASKTIAQLFKPLAVLVSSDDDEVSNFEEEDELRALSRDAWFNIVVHGFTLASPAGKQHARELQVLAQYSLPLVDEDRVDMPESGIDLNMVLRRGAGPQFTAEQKGWLVSALPQCESDIKGLGHPECVFLNAALLVSTMRAQAGDCTAVLPYFMESKVKTTPMGNCMLAIAMGCVDVYLQKALIGRQQSFAAPQIASQLVAFFEGCCHRIPKVQHAAVSSADRIINQIPSALCQKASLFALLELLSLMWKSCLDLETDEYDWKSMYSSAKGNVSVQLSDDADQRQTTLNGFHKRCRIWVAKAIDAAPLDVKGQLQAYLEDYEDDGAYGHIALGRSFAVEMGAMIPGTDQRLTSLDRERSYDVNAASDFITQYTTRQEYLNVDARPGADDQWTFVDHRAAGTATIASTPSREVSELKRLAQHLREHGQVPFVELRDILRSAAGALSRSGSDRTPLIQDLVGIPFAVFTKQSINLGISLWLGVIKENPSLESRILVEVAIGWETSVRLRKGFFDSGLHHGDPFYIKEEFAPSRWEVISKQVQVVHNLLAPHLRLAHFLSSHFSASRLTAPSVERVYIRMMHTTTLAMHRTISHPLAREVHFHILSLALAVLRYSTRLDLAAQWRLKDSILSAGLKWFSNPPAWSFGSNRLQVKAEVKLFHDVIAWLQGMSAIGRRPTASLESLQPKHELLVQLLQSEISRLTVWITPLAQESRGLAPLGQSVPSPQENVLSTLLSTAWREDPRIAVQLATRFPQAEKLHREIRSYLLREPEKAIVDANSLYVLLGSSLPTDVKWQLKYLLYWAPINPMAAVTYFLPAYGNNPYVIQYAVRALESHSVDVTFFYVPQIVQTLRYDGLGYVERYIVETAKFSQLFAHQIIWNMKANAYKDEDSQEPDSIKPTLDQVTNALISSFSAEDKVFYEREFDFFGKVTGISGTLKPFIKRPKPEKKQKIEEELRKIQLEVGVYLPSNPDGVVIGIDRKSGKPLQSHAKAPYMATFRIRKEEDDVDSVEQQSSAVRHGAVLKRKTYEAWQSAIFKVGDDCRQDVLALQLIAAFRGIFNNVGLDVYVFPYRVTATAPGSGVIDVLPNSISRDMLGREAVNGLYEYFVSKYGSEDSIRFQEARSNFIKSMAAYSIISYLLQFKDRHNGNIMVDDAGHILHIDFGFCFDIAPGGVKFERAPFKLSPEMVAVMGGSTTSAPFHAFEELCVKAFLASRQYVEQLAHIISMMLDSGLPCFKPTTIQHFKERFVMGKSEREAAEFVRKLVHWSERSYSTGVYDYYQLLTNGIPY